MSFKGNVQECLKYRNVMRSDIEGIDIEFTDVVDGRRKYCQLRSGTTPPTMKDIADILHIFRKMWGDGAVDKVPFEPDDLIVGIPDIAPDAVPTDYRLIEAHYPVFCGSDLFARIF